MSIIIDPVSSVKCTGVYLADLHVFGTDQLIQDLLPEIFRMHEQFVAKKYISEKLGNVYVPRIYWPLLAGCNLLKKSRSIN
jgi:hypothetical protein